ncbi:MAG TPA: hypothetical protein ENK27_01460 [Desulfobulbus sp.]|nr:hypothetical protein [Desulfobulbus sp.]
MKRTTALIAPLLTIALLTAPAMAQTGRATHPTPPPRQQMHANMMMGGGMGMGMMDGNGTDWRSEQWNRGCMGMMGGFMMSIMTPDQQQQFLDATRDLRRQMLELRFTYMETMRDPKATPADLARIESKMLDIRKQMMAKLEKLLNRKIPPATR